MMRWKLIVENKEIECLLNNRPTLNVEEISLTDVHTFGKVMWEPLFAMTHDSWVGKKDVELICCDEQDRQCETWELQNAELDGKHIVFSNAIYKGKNG